MVGRRLMAHNEDDDSFFVGSTALVHDVLAGWVAFYYPGELVGNAFGWNTKTGILLSSNELSPVAFDVNGAGSCCFLVCICFHCF